MEPIAQLQARVLESGSDAGARVELARTLLEAGQPGEALLHLRLAEASPDTRGEVRRLMGMAHLLSRDLPAAVEDLLAAARALPDDPGVRQALDAALEGLLEPSPEERAEAEAATESLMTLGIAPAAPFDPLADPKETEAAALDRLLGSLTDSCVEPPELAAAEPASAWTPEAEPLVEMPTLEVSGFDGAAADEPPLPVVFVPAALDEGPSPAEEEIAETAASTDLATQEAAVAGDDAAPSPARREAPSWDERQLDLNRLRRSLVAPSMPGHPATVTSTVMRRARTPRKRRTIVWASLVALLGAAAFGAVATRQGGGQAPPATVAEAAPVDPGSAVPEGAAEPHTDTGEPLPAGESATPPPVTTAPAPGQSSAEAVPEEPPAAEESPVAASYGPAPRYAFLGRLGLPAPPGGVIDGANSDAQRVMEEAGGRLSRPAVLTFRTDAPVEQVVGWYKERLPGVRFNARVVPMGGPFQGVQRTVARASTVLPRGYRIVLTISRPGVDTASRNLVRQTTVRVEIR